MSPSHGLVSDTELGILKVLWDLERGEGSVRDLLDNRPEGEPAWAYTTAQTLLNRLVEKGFLESRKEGRAHVFRPTVSRDELLGQSLQQLAERVCDGASLPLLLNLVNSSRFTAQEIRDFRSMLDQLEEDGGPAADGPGDAR